MSAEIESLSTDQNARRPGQGVSPMIVAMAVIALLGAIYAHWRLAQFDDRVDRVRRQIAGLHENQMLGAFFIATDPVSVATSDRGRLFYGAGIGALAWIIRTWGGYPDGIVFGVLLMNLAAPLLDRYTVPRIHGHPKR